MHVRNERPLFPFPFSTVLIGFENRTDPWIGSLFHEFPLSLRFLTLIHSLLNVGCMTLFVLSLRRKFKLN